MGSTRGAVLAYSFVTGGRCGGGPGKPPRLLPVKGGHCRGGQLSDTSTASATRLRKSCETGRRSRAASCVTLSQRSSWPR
jgi:hypothetical protein